MIDYEFKPWLTFEEAAAYLKDKFGKPYTPEALRRAAERRFIQVYYWSEDCENSNIGVYAAGNPPERPPELDDRRAESGSFLALSTGAPFAAFYGPVPFYDFVFFEMNKTRKVGGPLGITALSMADGDAWGCYRIGPGGEPLSLADAPYQVLIRLGDLEALTTPEPMVPVCRPHVGVGTLSMAGNELTWAFCAAAYQDPPPAFNPWPQPDQPDMLNQPDMPALKTLAFAAHLIANLAERLDAAEGTPSKKLGLKLSGKPNVSRIAAQLASTAASLKHTGHGYGAKGFQTNLKSALTSIDAPE